MKKYPIIFVVAVTLLLLTSTASAVLPQWVVDKLNKVPKAQKLYIINPEERGIQDINETTVIPSPPTPVPGATPKPPSTEVDFEFWQWINNYIYNNTLCRPVPPIDPSTLCPFAPTPGGIYPIFKP